MNKQIYLLLLLLSMLSLRGQAQDKPIAQPIILADFHNLYRVDSLLYRSEQPDSAGMVALQALGIRSIINFRIQQTDSMVIGSISGVQLLHYPMDARRITEADVVAVMQLIKSAPKPVLIHCLHGSDRTGCMAAAYRMSFDAWSREDAIAEFVLPQFGYHKFLFPGIKKLLKSLDVAHITERIDK